MVNVGAAVGVPVTLLVVAGVVAILVFCFCKSKYRRRYNLGGEGGGAVVTPEKKLTSHEMSIQSSTPPGGSGGSEEDGDSGGRNGSVQRRPQRPEILLRTPSREATEVFAVRRFCPAQQPEVLTLELGRLVATEVYVVRRAYSAQQPGELNLQLGRLVEVLEKRSNGWWHGIIEGQAGWMPSTHLDWINASDKAPTSSKIREAPAVPSSDTNHTSSDTPTAKSDKAQSAPMPPAQLNVKMELNAKNGREQGLTEATLTVDAQSKEPNGEIADIAEMKDLDENEFQGFINEIFTVEDETDSPSPPRRAPAPLVQTPGGETGESADSDIPPLSPRDVEIMTNLKRRRQELEEEEARRQGSTPELTDTVPAIFDFGAKHANTVNSADTVPATLDQSTRHTTHSSTVQNTEADTCKLLSLKSADVTNASTYSIEMRQSFGPESTFEVLDETDPRFELSTVKSDSPASLGQFKGVTSAGAWQQERHGNGSAGGVVIVTDDYSADQSSMFVHATEAPDVSGLSESNVTSLTRGRLELSSGSEHEGQVKGTESGTQSHSRPRPKSDARRHVYVAMFTYHATHDAQLSLAPNDVLFVPYPRDLNGWVKGYKRGHPDQEGWFPKSYVREGTSPGNLLQEGWFPKSYVHEGTSPGNLLQVPGSAAIDKSLSEAEMSDNEFQDQSFEGDLTGMAYRVQHPYTAQHEGDLTLLEGDTLVVLEALDNGWWRGVLPEGKAGWFPASYVQPIPQTPVIQKATPSLTQTGGATGAVTSQRVSWASDKQQLPSKFVIPKLMTVRSDTSVRAPSPDSRPPPPAPPTGSPRAPPRRRSSDRKSRSNSLPRPSQPPPPRPAEEEQDGGLGTSTTEITHGDTGVEQEKHSVDQALTKQDSPDGPETVNLPETEGAGETAVPDTQPELVSPGGNIKRVGAEKRRSNSSEITTSSPATPTVWAFPGGEPSLLTVSDPNDPNDPVTHELLLPQKTAMKLRLSVTKDKCYSPPSSPELSTTPRSSLNLRMSITKDRCYSPPPSPDLHDPGAESLDLGAPGAADQNLDLGASGLDTHEDLGAPGGPRPGMHQGANAKAIPEESPSTDAVRSESPPPLSSLDVSLNDAGPPQFQSTPQHGKLKLDIAAANKRQDMLARRVIATNDDTQQSRNDIPTQATRAHSTKGVESQDKTTSPHTSPPSSPDKAASSQGSTPTSEGVRSLRESLKSHPSANTSPISSEPASSSPQPLTSPNTSTHFKKFKKRVSFSEGRDEIVPEVSALADVMGSLRRATGERVGRSALRKSAGDESQRSRSSDSLTSSTEAVGTVETASPGAPVKPPISPKPGTSQRPTPGVKPAITAPKPQAPPRKAGPSGRKKGKAPPVPTQPSSVTKVSSNVDQPTNVSPNSTPTSSPRTETSSLTAGSSPTFPHTQTSSLATVPAPFTSVTTDSATHDISHTDASLASSAVQTTSETELNTSLSSVPRGTSPRVDDSVHVNGECEPLADLDSFEISRSFTTTTTAAAPADISLPHEPEQTSLSQALTPKHAADSVDSISIDKSEEHAIDPSEQQDEVELRFSRSEQDTDLLAEILTSYEDLRKMATVGPTDQSEHPMRDTEGVTGKIEQQLEQGRGSGPISDAILQKELSSKAGLVAASVDTHSPESSLKAVVSSYSSESKPELLNTRQNETASVMDEGNPKTKFAIRTEIIEHKLESSPTSPKLPSTQNGQDSSHDLHVHDLHIDIDSAPSLSKVTDPSFMSPTSPNQFSPSELSPSHLSPTSLPSKVKVRRYVIDRPAVISVSEDSGGSITAHVREADDRQGRREKRESESSEVFTPPSLSSGHSVGSDIKHEASYTIDTESEQLSTVKNQDSVAGVQNMQEVELCKDRPVHIPIIEITGTPQSQKMSRGEMPSVKPTAVSGYPVDTGLLGHSEEVHNLLASDPSLSLTSARLQGDASFRPDSPNSGVSVGSEPPPLPSMPPPPIGEGGTYLRTYSVSPSVSELSLDMVGVDDGSAGVEGGVSGGEEGSRDVSTVQDASWTLSKSWVHSPMSVDSAQESFPSTTGSPASPPSHTGEKQTNTSSSAFGYADAATPLKHQHLQHEQSYELMATSPIVVIRTPKRKGLKGRSQANETHESIDAEPESEQASSAPISVTSGFSAHLSSLFGMFFKGDDHLNSASAGGEYPVKRITFHRSATDLSEGGGREEDETTVSLPAGGVARSQSVNAPSMAVWMGSERQPLSPKSTLSLPSDANLTPPRAPSPKSRLSPQKPARRSRPGNRNSDSSQSESQSRPDSQVMNGVEETQSLPLPATTSSSVQDVKTFDSDRHSITDMSYTSTSVTYTSTSQTLRSSADDLIAGLQVLNHNTDDATNSMRFFSPLAFKPHDYSLDNITESLNNNEPTKTLLIENSSTLINEPVPDYHTVAPLVSDNEGSPAPQPYHNPQNNNELTKTLIIENCSTTLSSETPSPPVTPTSPPVALHPWSMHLVDAPQPYHSPRTAARLWRIPSFDARSDGVVVRKLVEPEDDVIDL